MKLDNSFSLLAQASFNLESELLQGATLKATTNQTTDFGQTSANVIKSIGANVMQGGADSVKGARQFG